ncbi:hypothetical protein K435DRAFT_864214 [Dendrothele bispora CBS 962.96]|uniref:C2H2-type domain-containing protein n=1 Tax=Dendrothele bispora (strain CBS 962.96) TaxID=1314807 RepID=A0A4S8LN40_DENBC|nr:hypothetical protein K435DRAFT_864214 [Dendrothele bispora CBS 962.96]
MFKTIPSCHPCSKEFKTIHARNIHLSRHCPYRNALKPKKRAKLTHPDNEDHWDTQRGTGDDHELGMDEVGDDNELEMAEEGAYEGLVLGNADSVASLLSRYIDSPYNITFRTLLKSPNPSTYQRVNENFPLVSKKKLCPIVLCWSSLCVYVGYSLENPNPTSMSLDLNFHNPVERDITPTPSLDEFIGDDIRDPYIFYYQTEPDEFGVFKVFESSIPTVDPDENISVNDVADAPTFVSNLGVDGLAQSYSNCFGVQLDDSDKNEGTDEGWAPFLNKSVFRLMDWFYRFPKNSLTALDSLVRDVILHTDFEQSDFIRFRAKAEVKKLDKYLGQDGDFEESEDPNPLPDTSSLRDGWYRTSVTVPLPHTRSRVASEKDAPTLDIDGVYYRKPLEVIKEALQDPSSTGFHLQGHKLLWRRSDGEPVQRLYSEVYTSDRMLEMEREVRSGPALPGPQSMADIYVFWEPFKVRQPQAISIWRISYSLYSVDIRSLPTADVLSHLKRELMQAVWIVLLNDPSLIEAFVNGLILTCLDGITRRFMIRWLTYSSDYPENCLVKKHMVIQLGLKRDMQRRVSLPRADSTNLRKRVKDARKQIYEKGRAVKSDYVKHALGDGSWTAISSVFSEVFFKYGFDYIKMFAVDLLHEIEIGTWKSIFVHFLRILFAIDRIQVDELDNPYRQVPPFGRETIRRINDNVALAVFEDLLPEPHNGILMDLIWDLATWHAYAKLRLHSDSTVESFRQVTQAFGDSLRKFVRKTCAEFDTTELDKEKEKRVRRTKRKNGLDTSTDPASEPHQKHAFNPNTLKFHAMGHYPDAVVYLGTTDIYSTQPVSMPIFGASVCGNKRSIKCGQSRPLRQNFTTSTEDSEPLPLCDPSLPYQMASGQRFYEEIPTLLASTKGDPAMNDFLFKLKNHCLQRVLNTELDTEFSDEDRRNLTFVSNLLYIHKYLRINYTTYDLRREQDSINPRTQPDVLLLAEDGEETGHPYWYARVISLFHVRVRHLGTRSRNTSEQRMEIAWARWYQLDDTIQSGWKAKRYHGLQFVPADSPDAFGFINPSQIIRAIHILPAFAYGTTSDYLPADSVARVYQSFENGEYNVEQEDWVYYYVNIFADRDIFMRFRGGGVGHVSTLEHTCSFETDAGVDEQSLPVYDKDGNVIETEEVSDSSDEEEETEEEKEEEGEEEEGSGNDDPNSDDNSDRSSDEYLDGDEEEEEDLDLGPEDGEVDDIDQLGLESLGYGNY